jgi:adenylate kinase
MVKVLVLGTSGLNKQEFLKNGIDIAVNKRYGQGWADPTARNYIGFFDVDRVIEEMRGGVKISYSGFLDNPDSDSQRALWGKAFETVLNKSQQYENVIVALHAVYYRRKRFFSALDISLLKNFKPDYIITLIDDSYNVANEINKREMSQYRTYSECDFLTALQWRELEIIFGDTLATMYGAKNYILPIKLGPETFYRLVFETWRLKIYGAYPITTARTDQQKLRELSHYRKQLKENFVLFDPASIDELLVMDEDSVFNKNFIIKVQNGKALVKRLPMDFTKYMPEELEEPSVNFQELVNLEDVIKTHITSRDFRLIGQVDVLTAYRPYWGGVKTPSAGVDAEMMHAIRKNIPVLVVHNESEDGSPPQMFRGIERAILFKNIDELINELTKMQEERKCKKS